MKPSISQTLGLFGGLALATASPMLAHTLATHLHQFDPKFESAPLSGNILFLSLLLLSALPVISFLRTFFRSERAPLSWPNEYPVQDQNAVSDHESVASPIKVSEKLTKTLPNNITRIHTGKQTDTNLSPEENLLSVVDAFPESAPPNDEQPSKKADRISPIPSENDTPSTTDDKETTDFHAMSSFVRAPAPKKPNHRPFTDFLNADGHIGETRADDPENDSLPDFQQVATKSVIALKIAPQTPTSTLRTNDPINKSKTPSFPDTANIPDDWKIDPNITSGREKIKILRRILRESTVTETDVDLVYLINADTLAETSRLQGKEIAASIKKWKNQRAIETK